MTKDVQSKNNQNSELLRKRNQKWKKNNQASKKKYAPKLNF